MPTIQLKRRTTSGNENVKLQAGEPYYNLKDRKLYIGTKDNESLEGRIHITQLKKRVYEKLGDYNQRCVRIWVGDAKDNKIDILSADILSVEPSELLTGVGEAKVNVAAKADTATTAKKAEKLAEGCGDTSTPVYFDENGKPAVCEGLVETVDSILQWKEL